ncbi:uncharacterized protein LOC132196159, partial [Neocloeon triangulifer]|uniref:uncharacterized protein LOC132196159 n=1 Tax=Neocloeon triangulifer TaxID=2078957 RepID=UPI00286F6CFD
ADANGINRPAVISISRVHNHRLSSADSLRLNRVPKHLEATFMSYFDDGHLQAQAKRLHEDLLVAKDALVDLADNAHNPTRRCVHHLHEKWTQKHFGGQNESPLTKIMEKNENNYYLERNTDVYVTVKDGLWAVLVVTPIMKRVQNLDSAKECLFVDSTSSVDVTHCTLTSMTIASKAGALPVCLLLHNGQSEESYGLAFSLVKQHCPTAFGGKEEPLVIMTDDSAAERAALTSVWPSARQLLRIFHVLSKEWKWLLSNSSMNSRKKLMDHCYKAFNPVALVEFIMGPMESYYKRRLLDHAHNRHSAHTIVFHKLLSRIEKVKPESIKQTEEFVFSVPSAQRNAGITSMSCGVAYYPDFLIPFTPFGYQKSTKYKSLTLEGASLLRKKWWQSSKSGFQQ